MGSQDTDRIQSCSLPEYSTNALQRLQFLIESLFSPKPQDLAQYCSTFLSTFSGELLQKSLEKYFRYTSGDPLLLPVASLDQTFIQTLGRQKSYSNLITWLSIMRQDRAMRIKQSIKRKLMNWLRLVTCMTIACTSAQQREEGDVSMRVPQRQLTAQGSKLQNTAVYTEFKKSRFMYDRSQEWHNSLWGW